MQIVIADSHMLCREALNNYLRYAAPDMSVRGVDDYGALGRVLNEEGADVLLLNPELPGIPLLDHYADVDLSRPDMSVGLLIDRQLNLSSIPYETAKGIFFKNLPCKTLMKGILQLAAGEKFYPDDEMILQFTDGEKAKVLKTPDDFHLTQRERQVTTFLAKGATNKEIARDLDLQVVTVKLHVRGICRKIGAANRTQAALIITENGWDD